MCGSGSEGEEMEGGGSVCLWHACAHLTWSVVKCGGSHHCAQYAKDHISFPWHAYPRHLVVACVSSRVNGLQPKHEHTSISVRACYHAHLSFYVSHHLSE